MLKNGIAMNFMRAFSGALAMCALLSLTGCVSIESVVAADAKPDAQSGYVAGLFTRGKVSGFAFVIRDENTGTEYGLSMGQDTFLPSEANEQTVAIKLPKGTYRVTHWTTYATITKERSTRKEVPQTALATSFTLEGGAVVHLGSYSLTQTSENRYPTLITRYQVQPKAISAVAAKAAFAKEYPNLADLPFKCLTC